MVVSVIVVIGCFIKGVVYIGVYMRGIGRWVVVFIKKIGIINSNVWIFVRFFYCFYGYLKELYK